MRKPEDWGKCVQWETPLIILAPCKNFPEDIFQPKTIISKISLVISSDSWHVSLYCSKRTHHYILNVHILLYKFIYSHIPADIWCSKNIHALCWVAELFGCCDSLCSSRLLYSGHFFPETFFFGPSCVETFHLVTSSN